MGSFSYKSKKNYSDEKPRMKWKTIGKIPSFIGEGNNAKHSIVTIIIICCFTSALVVTIIVVVNYWAFRDCENKVPDIVGDLKVIWEIVTPIITLALGYEFGKLEK